jgi:hypothetical protein
MAGINPGARHTAAVPMRLAGANGAAHTTSLPQLCERATGLIAQTRTENLREMLSKPESAKAAAKWFVRQGVLEQFNTAREIEAEDAA